VKVGVKVGIVVSVKVGINVSAEVRIKVSTKAEIAAVKEIKRTGLIVRVFKRFKVKVIFFGKS
jgi:hypothetical protein